MWKGCVEALSGGFAAEVERQSLTDFFQAFPLSFERGEGDVLWNILPRGGSASELK